MAEKKSIIEEAVLDIKKIQDALNANTKEILRSVAKEEIDGVVKESILKEDGFEEEDLDAPTDDVAVAEPEMGAEAPAELGGEESTDDLGGIEGSEEVVSAEPEMGLEPELGMDADALAGDTMDMTAASDDDVIAIYKKLSGEDEIEIVGDEIHLNISEPGEYVVKTNDVAPVGGEAEVASEIPTDLVPVEGGEEGEEEAGEDGGLDYEIAMDVEEGEGEAAEAGAESEESEETADNAGEEEEEEEEIEENLAQTRGSEKHAGKYTAASKNPKPLEESAKLVSETENKYKALLKESNSLKVENEQFREALKKFRSMLVETVVFNSNLTYVTKLFTEHSTTKAEKKTIMGRFDEEVSNLKESKKLYKTIEKELTDRKPVNEAVESKIIKEVASGKSTQLNESTAYVDPSTKRIMDLINRVENR
jgi:hypothetical protein